MILACASTCDPRQGLRRCRPQRMDGVFGTHNHHGQRSCPRTTDEQRRRSLLWMTSSAPTPTLSLAIPLSSRSPDGGHLLRTATATSVHRRHRQDLAEHDP